VVLGSSPEGLASNLREKIRSVLKLRADLAFVNESDIKEPDKLIRDLRKWD
jgi:hypothetical protein